MTREEYDATWEAVTAGEVADPTPYGMGGDWCPFCAADWRQPHGEGCASPYAGPLPGEGHRPGADGAW